MYKRKIAAIAMAIAVAGTSLVPTITSNAAGLTQTTDASKVTYGSLSKADVAVMKNLFDFEFYKAQNPDVVKVLGDNYNALFRHFCKCGIFEGRTCNPNFDPAAYASAYSDLKAKFGTDIVKFV